MHTKTGVADQFIKDVTAEVATIMKNPGLPIEGKVNDLKMLITRDMPDLIQYSLHFPWQMAIYGVAQTIPDRRIVGDITRAFLDSMYYTPAQGTELTNEKWTFK